MRLPSLIALLALLLSACSSPSSAPPTPQSAAGAPGHGRTFIIGKAAPEAERLPSGNRVQSQQLSMQMLAEAPLEVGDADITVPISSPDPSISALTTAEPGDHIVSAPIPDAPYGFVREVTGKTVNGDSVTLNTQESSLEQSVENLEVDENLNIDAQSLEKVEFASGNVYTFKPGEYSAELAKQQRLSPQATFHIAGFSKSFDEKIQCGSEQIAFSGSVDANLDAFFNVSISWFSLKKFEAGVKFSEAAKINFLAQCKDGFSVEKKLATFTYGTRVVFVWGFPIVITPQVELWIGANGQITGKVVFTVDQSFTARYGVGYYKGQGWKVIDETQRTFNHTQDANATGKVRGWIGVKGSLWFYGSAQVYAFPKAFLEAEGTLTPQLAQFCLYGGWNLSVGAKVKIIFWTLAQWDHQVLEQKWQLLCKTLSDPPPPPPPPTGTNQAPTASFTYTQSRLTGTVRLTSTSTDPDGTLSAYAWDFGDGTTGSGAQVSHAYDPGDYVVTLTVTDNLGAQHTVSRNIFVAEVNTCPNRSPAEPLLIGCQYP